LYVEESRNNHVYKQSSSVDSDSDSDNPPVAVTIDRVRLKNLFGLYTYDIAHLGKR
jgi:hypothetical protein